MKNRRHLTNDPHRLMVSIITPETTLRVSCSCGAILNGRRVGDRRQISLSDLLELVRMHSIELNSGR